MNRPGRWDLLGGDPTPGDPAAIAGTAQALAVAAEASVAAMAAGQTVAASAADGWKGATTMAFSRAVADRLALLAAAGSAYLACGEVLHAWSQRLDGLQDEAGLLLQQAEHAEEVRLAAEARRPGLKAAVVNGRQLVQSTVDPVHLIALQQALAVAEHGLLACDKTIAQQGDQLARLVEAAQALGEEATQAGAAQAGLVGALLAAVPDAVPFAMIAAAIGVEVSLGIVVDADGDGTVSAAELQAVLDALDPARAEGTSAAAALLHALAADPDQAALLVEGLGPDGVEGMLHLLGGVPPGDHVDDWLAVLDGATALLGAGAAAGSAAAEVIRQVIGEAILTEDLVVLAGLSRVEGLPPALGVLLVDLLHRHDGLDGYGAWPGGLGGALLPEAADPALVALQAAVTNLAALDLVDVDGSPNALGATILSGALGLTVLPHLWDVAGGLVSDLVGGLMSREDGPALDPQQVIDAITEVDGPLGFTTLGLIGLLAPALVDAAPNTTGHTALMDQMLDGQSPEVLAAAADTMFDAVMAELKAIGGDLYNVGENGDGVPSAEANDVLRVTLEKLGPVLNAIVGRAVLDSREAALDKATTLGDLSEAIGAAGSSAGAVGAPPQAVVISAIISAALGIAANHVRPDDPDVEVLAAAELDPALAQEVVMHLDLPDPAFVEDLLVTVEMVLDDLVMDASQAHTSTALGD